MTAYAANRCRLVCLGLTMFATAVFGQSASTKVSPNVVFQGVRARLLNDWSRMPRYTCVQDIGRRFYRSDRKSSLGCSAILARRTIRKHDLPLALRDHLQLDVAVADKREVHSWPGAANFSEEDEIRKLIGNGAFGSGDFAAFVGGVFGGSAKITYEGERIVDGRTLLEYSFQVPASASRYQVESKTGPVVTAYDGSFWLDPQKGDLDHLTVRTAELPKGTDSCQGINEIEYGRTDIHGIDVLVPRQTDLRVVFQNGDEAVTRTSYSSCREFASKVSFRFDNLGPAPSSPRTQAAEPAGQKLRVTPFPAGLKFDCHIVTPIDADTAAGQPIEAVLRSPIRDKNNSILAPSGSRVRGRLVRLAQHFSTYDYFEVALRFESVEVNGAERPLYAALVDQPQGPMTPKAQVGYAPSDFPEEMASPTGLLPNTGEFFLVQEHLRLRGFNAKWVTTSRDARQENQPAPQKPNTQRVIASAASTNTPQRNEQALPPPAPTTSPVVVGAQHKDSRPVPDTTSTTEQKTPDFRLRVESDLVVVRAVVRDAQGKPVENLTKEDFILLDKGKEQTISQFEAVSSPAQPVTPHSREKFANPSSTVSVSPARPSFLALYFDDLNTSDMDMVQARDAADGYLENRLAPNQKVGIFTSEGALSDFTADPKQIHDALAKLHASPRALTRLHDCPELSDYQALQISESENNSIDAWKMALDEAAHRCGMLDPQALESFLDGSKRVPLPEIDSVMAAIRAQARSVLAQVEIQARSNLRQLEQVVSNLSQLAGQRTIVLVSTGFLSQSEQFQLDKIIDQALRMEVVVSSLDPKGLALLMREAEVTRGYAPTARSGTITSAHNFDFNREARATDVLAELAEGTGGEYFHNNNDLNAGFDALAGSPACYILAFVPSTFDGKFHKLEVKLTRTKGNVQARRGYFALKNEPKIQPEVGSEFEAKTKNDENGEVRQAMASQEELRGLSIDVSTEVEPSSGETEDLTVIVRLDLSSVPFRKEGDRNLNRLTFAAGIYDEKGKWVNGEQKQVELEVPDPQLQNMRANGVGVKHTFILEPGKYSLREVVQDSEDRHLAALNRSIEIP
jgi:VWFA-related protein